MITNQETGDSALAKLPHLLQSPRDLAKTKLCF